jgi:hypothetical protein
VVTGSGDKFRVVLNMVGPNSGVSLGAAQSGGWGSNLYTVPADRQAIVEFVAMDCTLPQPSVTIAAALSLTTDDPGAFNERIPNFRLAVLDQGVSGSLHYFAVSQPVKIYVDPGQGFGIGMTQANPTPTNGNTNCSVSVKGTLLPISGPGPAARSKKTAR